LRCRRHGGKQRSTWAANGRHFFRASIPGALFRTPGRCPYGTSGGRADSESEGHGRMALSFSIPVPGTSPSSCGNLSPRMYSQPSAGMSRGATPISVPIFRHSHPGRSSIRSEIMKSAPRPSQWKRCERPTQIRFSGILILSFPAFLMKLRGFRSLRRANVQVELFHVPDRAGACAIHYMIVSCQTLRTLSGVLSTPRSACQTRRIRT
jgi:hypothetical protein